MVALYKKLKNKYILNKKQLRAVARRKKKREKQIAEYKAEFKKMMEIRMEPFRNRRYGIEAFYGEFTDRKQIFFTYWFYYITFSTTLLFVSIYYNKFLIKVIIRFLIFHEHIFDSYICNIFLGAIYIYSIYIFLGYGLHFWGLDYFLMFGEEKDEVKPYDIYFFTKYKWYFIKHLKKKHDRLHFNINTFEEIILPRRN